MDFESLYSDRSKGMKASEIRELLKISQLPGVISFAGGLPNPKAFPVSIIKEISSELLEENGATILQYGQTEGLMELRELLAERLQKDGIEADMDNILITVGSQEGLDITGKIFLNKDDVVLLGLPSYLGGINAFRAYRSKLEGIPLDDEGMAVGLLEEKILELEREGKKIKIIYVIPTFQNPAGVVMPESRRKKLVEIAREHDLMIVEDDPYSKLRFDGDPVKPIKAFDENVIYMATFSKILSPGFRLAFIAAPKDVIRKMAIAKQSIDLCSPTITQFIAYEIIKRGLLDEHIPRIAEMYKKKRDIMINAMEEYFPDGCKWTRPNGGMFLWVRLPENVSTMEMFNDALRKKVAYVHGKAFHVDGSGTNTMRLNFSNPSDEEIKKGIKRLGEVIEERI